MRHTEFKGYEPEILDEDYDDGTMPESLEALRQAVVGHRIVAVIPGTKAPEFPNSTFTKTATVLMLDNGKAVALVDTDDCCAYTELQAFLMHPDKVDHAILGVGTTDGYQTWHIFCDYGDILELTVGWSCGNPFYYGYGFDIRVADA